MKKRRSYLMMAGLLVIPGVVTLAAAKAPSLNELLALARTEAYVQPEAGELVQVEERFREWFSASDRLETVRKPGSSDFTDLALDLAALSEPGLVALSEAAVRRHGRGLFAARISGGTPLLIQAPHQYHDLRTGVIARQLFLEGSAMAASWNTVHRYQSDHSDLVHIADSYLHASSRAFADLYPRGRIVQLHGFSAAKRTSAAGRTAQAILSDGSRSPPDSLLRLADCMTHRLGIRARVYPHEVRELGATTNTLAADLRGRGFEGFVHLELDADLRKRLAGNRDARQRLLSCLTDTHP